MSVEFLKALFSDKALTFDEFAKAVADSKDIKLANLADGKYVDKQKLDDKAGELKPWRRIRTRSKPAYFLSFLLKIS